jgi:hypothetical protein
MLARLRKLDAPESDDQHGPSCLLLELTSDEADTSRLRLAYVASRSLLRRQNDTRLLGTVCRIHLHVDHALDCW